MTKTLNELYNENRLDFFVMAVTHLLDLGFRRAAAITDEQILTIKGNGLMTAGFCQDLTRLARDIAKACGNDLVSLIQFCNAKDVFEKRKFDNKATDDEPNYWVTMRIEGRYVVPVHAENHEEARIKANEAYWDADFGELEDIDGACVTVENENGDFVWER